MNATANTYLVGFKEIAAFLRVSKRTAERLAHEGMPVLREEGRRRGVVRVEVSALKMWWEKRLKT